MSAKEVDVCVRDSGWIGRVVAGLVAGSALAVSDDAGEGDQCGGIVVNAIINWRDL